ncbi:L-rhamnose/proton symporter RhaT [Maribellus mangrovi]|uniref:L-rhamnose/proton symporter RhaT n=1 Tax=Maribellus mangrovi TaxID=3133146 RepID=UPI0030EEF6B4
MITPNPIIGTGYHAIGGISASTCYLPFQKIKKWSWGTYWLVQAFFAWIVLPLVIGWLTVPGFFHILATAPKDVVWGAFLLGAVYGFGGMSFGFAIRHIGYSLTYTFAIGLSAILGTFVPLIVYGGLVEYFTAPGGMVILLGILIALLGVGLSGLAGFRKEKDLRAQTGEKVQFNMKVGLVLVLIAGVLSAVFNISLEHGQPISDMARANGAGQFEGNAKYIVSTSGTFLVNLVWFVVLGIRQKTLKEFSLKSGISTGNWMKNFFWSALSGALWFGQFFFYGLGHVKMGKFQFISWVLHMSMLIFFSYIVGMIMKEWRNVSGKTFRTLIVALVILIISFIVITYGSSFQ